MKGLLYFTWFNWEYVAAGVYQYLIDDKELTELTIITCDGYNLPCHSNYNSDPSQCQLCKLNKNFFLENLNNNKNSIQIKHYTIESLSNYKVGLSYDQIQKEYKETSSTITNYLKALDYKKSKIGAGVLSTYISHTRNYRPISDDFTKDFFFRQVNKLSQLYEKVNQLILDKEFDNFILFNGRSNDTRIIFDLFVSLGYEKTRVLENLIITEDTKGEIRELGVEVLPALLPQDILYRGKEIESLWDKADHSTRVQIGESYFKERINDLNTTKHKDLFSKNWNTSLNPFLDKKSIKVTIFNSSSDEIASIPELEEYNYFGEQNDSIRELLRILDELGGFEIILRIHPNLSNVNYKYHEGLYILQDEFKGLKIFDANSSINSYNLVKYSDLIFTYGSTIGVEATYLKKPVINMGAASYFNIDATYNPISYIEVKELLKNARLLKPKPLINALKYGYYRNNPVSYSNSTTKVFNFLNIFSFYNFQLPIFKFQILKLFILIHNKLQLNTNKGFNPVPKIEEE
jgi:hypothetical protein